MTRIIIDLHYALRRLLANPGFSTAVIMTMALGVGAGCLYLNVVDSVLLRPPPYRDSQRLVYVWETDAHNASSREGVSWPDLRDWRQQARSFDAMAGYTRQSLSLTEIGADPERVVGFAASADLFPLLGLRAQIGRLLETSDDVPNAAPVAVLSQELWQRRFAADPHVIGKIIQFDGTAHEIIGVLPALPAAPLNPAVWVSLQRALGGFVEERGVHTLTTIARLRDGTTAEQAQQEMDAIAARLDALYPADNVGRGARVEGMHDFAIRDLRQPLLMLGGVFALLMLIAAVNVASLMLAHASTRRRELAVRTAIGAVRARIVAQLAIEGLMIGTLAGCAGLLLTWISLAAVRAWIPTEVIDGALLHLDHRVVLSGIGLSVLLSVIATILPLLSLLRAGTLENLRGGGLQGQGKSSLRARRALVGVQVALAMALVVTSGLLLHSFWLMTQIRTGLVSEQTLALSIRLPQAQYPMPPLTEYPHWPAVTQFYDRLLDQLHGVVGVQAVALGHAPPLSKSWTTQVRRTDATDPQAAKDEWEMRPVSPGYFAALGIPLLRGRELSSADRAESAPVLLINEAAARRYFPGEDPVGKHVLLWKKSREVIGVVGDVRSLSPNEAAAPSVFPPLVQAPFQDITIVVRTDHDPLALLPALRTAIWRAQPNLALFSVSTLDQEVQTALGGTSFGTGVVAAFAVLALILSAIGVFGMVALEVGQRTAEIGLRLALGARGLDVLRLSTLRTLTVVAFGAIAGSILVLFAGRLLQSVLYGVSAYDPATWLTSVVVLFLVALVASVIPARRALRIDPMVALRHE
ncbi:MAG: ABC transporter permease [Dokdonella sp.]